MATRSQSQHRHIVSREQTDGDADFFPSSKVSSSQLFFVPCRSKRARPTRIPLTVGGVALLQLAQQFVVGQTIHLNVVGLDDLVRPARSDGQPTRCRW
jgi:hypothetical protein